MRKIIPFYRHRPRKGRIKVPRYIFPLKSICHLKTRIFTSASYRLLMNNLNYFVAFSRQKVHKSTRRPKTNDYSLMTIHYEERISRAKCFLRILKKAKKRRKTRIQEPEDRRKVRKQRLKNGCKQQCPLPLSGSDSDNRTPGAALSLFELVL